MASEPIPDVAILDNSRHERFAQGLAAGKTAEEAYVEAGYNRSRPAASRLSTNVNVQRRVAELLSRATDGGILPKQLVLERLIENANRAMQAEPARNEAGAAIGDYHYQGSVANRALELLGKELGMFVDRREVGKPGEFDALTDAELQRRIAELDREIALGRPNAGGAKPASLN